MKIKRYAFCVLLIVANLPLAYAEVFKCRLASGKTVYQPEPCSSAASQRIIEVEKMTPEQMEVAKRKLHSWQDQQAVEDAAKAREERMRQLDRERQESLDLQRRSVMAQEQQAIAAQQQNQRRPGFIYPDAPCAHSAWEPPELGHRYRSDDCYPGQRGNYPLRPPRQTPHQKIQLPDKVERFDADVWSGRPLGSAIKPK